MNNELTPSPQKELYQEIEEWQKLFMDDVYRLFLQDNEPEGNIAFDNWEGRFLRFLEKRLPTKKEDYQRQTHTRVSVKTIGMTALSFFNQRRGNAVRAFITQLIEDAKRGYLADEIVRDTPQEVKNNPPASTQLRIFISHSSRDLELVALVVDLLHLALHLATKDLRCTSLDGYRLPGGADIDSQLRSEIMHATTLIGVISNDSFDSAYVLFELGARWGQGTNLIPLLAHGMSPSSLQGPITRYNALSCESEEQLQQLIYDVGRQIGVTPEPPHAVQAKIRTIVNYRSSARRKRAS